jgi:DNA sulfur modification protein DndB
MATVLNVIKGEQGTHEYFVTTLEFGDIGNLVVLPEDVLGDRLLDDEQTMQRKLNKARVNGDMKNYLLNSDDAFYSALTLFIVPRDFTPLEEGEGYMFQPSPDNVSAGKLILHSTVVLFPADGQHRAASIKQALKDQPMLAGKHIPVVLIPYVRPQIVRQMFSDLNLNAKPVSKSVGLSFETRDPVTMLAKQLITAVPLFKDRVNRASNSLPDSSTKVITLSTLHAVTEEMLGALGTDVAGLKLDTVPVVVGKVADLVEQILGAFPQWENVLSGKTSAGDLRKAYVFPHGIGWQGIAKAASVVFKVEARKGHAEEGAIHRALRYIDWSRSNLDFQRVATVGDRVNNTGPGIRALAGYILVKAGYTSEPEAASYIDAYNKSTSESQAA